MIQMRSFRTAGLALACFACGDDDKTTDTRGDASDAADTAADTSPADSADTSDDTAAPDTSIPDMTADSAEVETIDNPFGFPIRIPESHRLECADPLAEEPIALEQLESDWLCTYAWDGESGFVYVQADPTECTVVFGAMPVFGVGRGWISLDGEVGELTNAEYDWGGNHHNDSITFRRGDERFTLYHSSFGFGFRKCQEMDCIQVRASADGAMIEDGCTPERTLPIVCSPIGADGTWAPLVDTYQKCNGDPNAGPE